MSRSECGNPACSDDEPCRCDEMTRRAAAAQAIARVLACFRTDDPDTWTAQQRVSPIRVGDIKRAKDALVVLQTQAGEGWWHQVAIGLAAEIGKMQATWPRCEWRDMLGGPQCVKPAGHGLPHRTISDGSMGSSMGIPHSAPHIHHHYKPAVHDPNICGICGDGPWGIHRFKPAAGECPICHGSSVAEPEPRA